MNSKKTVFSALVILAVLFSALALPGAALADDFTVNPGDPEDGGGDVIGTTSADVITMN